MGEERTPEVNLKWFESMKSMEGDFTRVVAEGLYNALERRKRMIREYERRIERHKRAIEHIRKMLFSEKFLPYVMERILEVETGEG